MGNRPLRVQGKVGPPDATWTRVREGRGDDSGRHKEIPKKKKISNFPECTQENLKMCELSCPGFPS